MSVPSRVSCLCPKKGPPKLPTLEKPSHWQSLQSLQSSLRTKVLICKTLRRPQAAKLAEIFFGGKVFWGGKSWWGFVIFGWVVFWSFVCGYFRYRFTIYKHPGGGGTNTNSMIHETEKQRDPFVLPPPFNLCVCVKGHLFCQTFYQIPQLFLSYNHLFSGKWWDSCNVQPRSST